MTETVGGTELQGLARSALPAAIAAMVAVPPARRRRKVRLALFGVPGTVSRRMRRGPRSGDEAAGALGRGHQVIVGQVGIAGGVRGACRPRTGSPRT